ncbi:hypothetical protein CS542_06015 [Pedobacter sp. IW39]|nr:hypothetical protein CS542_06015 [Pedobacter sp. IW39]
MKIRRPCFSSDAVLPSLSVIVCVVYFYADGDSGMVSPVVASITFPTDVICFLQFRKWFCHRFESRPGLLSPTLPHMFSEAGFSAINRQV